MTKTILKAWRGVLPATLFLVLLAPAALAAPTGAQILLAMKRAEREVSSRGTLVVQRPGAPTIKARVWKSGAKRRLEFLAPKIMSGDILLDDGTYIRRYHKSEKNAVQTRSAPASSLDLGWKQLQSRYDAKVSGAATVAKRKAWIVTLAPRGSRKVIRKFWIDQKNKAQLRVEHYSNGRRSETMVLQSVAFEKVPAAKFVWSTPSGAKLTKTGGTMFPRAAQAKTVANWLKLPSSPPSGYAFESAIVDNSKREAWLRYTNGLNRFSIFQQRANDNKTSPPKRINGAWFWQSGGFRFLVVGLSQAGAKQVAGQMS